MLVSIWCSTMQLFCAPVEWDMEKRVGGARTTHERRKGAKVKIDHDCRPFLSAESIDKCTQIYRKREKYTDHI